METINSAKNKRILNICKKMSQNEVSISVSEPREDLIRNAVKFLIDPKISGFPRERKESFLQSKGLSSNEIALAFERSLSGYPKFGVVNPELISLQPVTPFQKFREILHTIALITGVSYGIYYFIKKCIIPFLFGKPKKPTGIEGAIIDLQKEVKETVGSLQIKVDKVQADLEKVVDVQSEQQTAVRNLEAIKSEVSIVKGILLSRHQFPAVDSTSIPAWQMAACADSGDRSSPIVLPNSNGGSQNSDSSLEMIKEVEVHETEA